MLMCKFRVISYFVTLETILCVVSCNHFANYIKTLDSVCEDSKTFQGLMQKAMDDISDREIDSIAHKIGFDWESIGTFMDYESNQIDALKSIYRDQPVARNTRMIKKWADVVASCGESPRTLLAAAFASRQNIEMAQSLVPAEQVEAIKVQEARQETKEKIKLINFDIPGIKQPDFFFPQVRSSDQSQISLPGCFLQIEDRRTMVYEQKLLVDAAKSVGKLCSRNMFGTCFRVGHKYVMTARHVVMGIVNNGIISLGRGPPTSFAALDSEDVYVTFDFEDIDTTTPRKFYLTSSVVFEDEALDIAVVELKPDQELPSPFCNFGMAKPGSKFVFLGHPFGERKQMNDVDGLIALTPETKEAAVAWSIKVASIDGFAGIDKPGRILFHCSFQEGGSGSPGIAVEGKKVVVVTVLLQGYPDWFYDPGFNQDIKNRVEKGSRIEQGVNMLAVYEKMHKVNRDLCYAIFGMPNE